MATVNISFFHLGQLYGSLGESEGWGTSTTCPVGSCLSIRESIPRISASSSLPSSLSGDVPGTCSRLRSSKIPRGMVVMAVCNKMRRKVLLRGDYEGYMAGAYTRSSTGSPQNTPDMQPHIICRYGHYGYFTEHQAPPQGSPLQRSYKSIGSNGVVSRSAPAGALLV